MRPGLALAELSIVVEGAGPFRQREHFAPAASRLGQPTLRLQAEFAQESLRPAGEPIIECDTWAAFSNAGTLSLVSHLGTWSPREVARVDLDEDRRTGRLLMRPGLRVDPLDYPLDQLLVIQLLHDHGGLLLHAACFIVRGRAFVVAGVSGQGKTTFARAAAADSQLTVLTDERVVLRKREGQWFGYGTPWVGEGAFADPGSAPLAAIYLLDKSNRDELSPLSPVRALATLVGCHFPAGWIGDAATQISPLEDLVAEIPCYRLRTRLGGDSLAMVLACEELR